MEKELIFVDFEEVYELSELHGDCILRILYDEYIPKTAVSCGRTPSIIYQKERERFAIYF